MSKKRKMKVFQEINKARFELPLHLFFLFDLLAQII
jgi:hypothetical protein